MVIERQNKEILYSLPTAGILRALNRKIMQQTFEINTNQFDQLYDAVMAKFGNRKVKVVVEDVETETVNQEEALKKFVGSWEGDETGDELVEMIYSARNDRPRDIEL